MASSITSFPVRQNAHTSTVTPCSSKQNTNARSRRSKSRSWTTKQVNQPNNTPCGLVVTTSSNPQPPTALDGLQNNSSKPTPKPSLHPDDSKSANCAGKKSSFLCLEADVEENGSVCVATVREKLMSMFQASDNKLAMKLFGNRNALMKERLRQRAANNWVIHPCSYFR